MEFVPTAVDGVVVVELEEVHDERGWFARVFDRDAFDAAGLVPDVVQCSLSYSARVGTVRGMHLQIAPDAEAKLVRCVAGAIADVALDLRKGSRTFGEHILIELSAENRRALYLPPYVAHGFQTLRDGSEVLYQISGRYVPASGRGFRHDDPAFGIRWPLPVTVVSDKDRSWPLHATDRKDDE